MMQDELELKVMAYLDGELPASEMKEVADLIEKDTAYREAYLSLKKMKEVTQKMKFRQLPEMFWDEYWEHVYNRIERGISWILISLGAIIIGSFLAWHLIEKLLKDQNINVWLKAGIFIFFAGIIVLFLSILREKIMVRKVDKYREIER